CSQRVDTDARHELLGVGLFVRTVAGVVVDSQTIVYVLQLVKFYWAANLEAQLRRREAIVVPWNQSDVPKTEQIFFPWNKDIRHRATRDRVSLERRRPVKKLIVLYIPILEAHVETAVQVRGEGSVGSDLWRGSVSNRAVYVGSEAEGQAIGGEEVKVEVGAGDVERVEDIVLWSWVVDVFKFLRLEAGVRVQAVVRIKQGADPELVLEVVDIGAPRGFDFGDLVRQIR